MRTIRMLLLVSAAGFCAWAGDAQNGALVLSRQGCLECHAVRATATGHELPPGTGAPDLGDRLTPAYTPSALASALWNHTPEMWRKMMERQTGVPDATSAEWADVFAYLYSLQFSEKPAEVTRGKAAFESKCSACHSLADRARGSGKSLWTQVTDPVVLVDQMWNHSTSMATEFARRKMQRPVMTGRDFMDLTAYLQYREKLPPKSRLSLPDAASGQVPFAENCGKCHTGPMALENRVHDQTWMDLGAAMWNHEPLMKSAPALPPEVMRKILAFVWEEQYQGPQGNRAAGQRVFESAGCIGCHRSPANGAPMSPRSTEKKFTPYSMVVLGWGPARTMHLQMLDKGVAWPKLSPENMNDLAVYLNSLPKQ